MALTDLGPAKAEAVRTAHGLAAASVHDDAAAMLTDEKVLLVAAAAAPADRAALGIRVMEAGKDYFTDRTPLTTMDE